MKWNKRKSLVGENVKVIERLFDVFPQLVEEDNDEWLAILGRSRSFIYPEQTMLVTTGATCTGFMLLLDGTVRVFQHAEDGREVTLYRIGSGDLCLMSLNSLIHNKPFRGNAQSETEIMILSFDADDFQKAMKVSDNFRHFILSNLVNTVCSMVHMLHETAFESLETRLGALLNHSFSESKSNSLNITHQELAQELGSSREVISRLLKKMEKNNCIILKRSEILSGKNLNQLRITLN